MKRYEVILQNGYSLIQNQNGPLLGMGEVNLKEADGLAFKNLSGRKDLLPYEDWRLTPEERAQDLASHLSPEEIAGLMLFSPHQMVPFLPGTPFVGHYNGEDYQEGKTDPAALTDEQTGFLKDNHIRNFLLTQVRTAEISAQWNNRLQAEAEKLPWGIPVCISSDPRHAAGARTAEFSSSGQEISRWPEGLGMAATFSPELVEEFARVVATEYRALGISVALGPQIDLATEPRWMRYEDTWGGDADLVTAMARAYCDGLQTTPGAPGGWGQESVAAMVKHWPGGGTGEGGRDAHYPYGKFGVFPGGRLETHMKPFAEGAFRLNGPTRKAAAVMPYYTISWDQDAVYGENVGNAYSRYMIQDLLRGKFGYDGIICTDWDITADPAEEIDAFPHRCHGVENMNETERHWKLLSNGVDMFGGNSDIQPVLSAYRLGCRRMGAMEMRARFEQSAKKILTNMFRLGLFENPYLDKEISAATVGSKEFVQRGREAQRRSVVLLKNKGRILPLQRGLRVYVPRRQIETHLDFFRIAQPARTIVPLTQEEADGWFSITEDPSEADAAVVFVESPLSEGYCSKKTRQNETGYIPISMQYRPYRADLAREHSIARGDFRENDCDRSYRGRVGTARNEHDLDLILEARKSMGDKPVIVCMHLHNPTVVAEFEHVADGILAHFGVDTPVLLDILCGMQNPGGRLPFIMPASMNCVETHMEDVFDDMEAYQDQCENRYCFGFGLSYANDGTNKDAKSNRQ